MIYTLKLKSQSRKRNPLGVDKPRNFDEALAAIAGEVIGYLFDCHSHRQQLLKAQLLLQFRAVPQKDIRCLVVNDGAEEFLQVIVLAELEREYL